jgi:hypothetical protein
MLKLSISFAKKDRSIYKKIQWKMSQNSELAAGKGMGEFSTLLGRAHFPGGDAGASPRYRPTDSGEPVARARCVSAAPGSAEQLNFPEAVLGTSRDRPADSGEPVARARLAPRRGQSAEQLNFPEAVLGTSPRDRPADSGEPVARARRVRPPPAGDAEQLNFPEAVLILYRRQMQKACSLSRLFEFGR